MELPQWTGVRCVDAVRLGPCMIDPLGILAFKQQKTGVDAFVLWHPPALNMDRDREDLLTLTANIETMVFLVTNYDKPPLQESIQSMVFCGSHQGWPAKPDSTRIAENQNERVGRKRRICSANAGVDWPSESL